MKKITTVSVPATSANLGPGFDVLGVALGLFNDVHFSVEEWTTKPSMEVRVDVQGAGADELPRNASNLVVQAANHIFTKAKHWPKRLDVRLMNRIPLSRGMGSSSAAIVGGLAAANRLLDNRFSDQTLFDLAVSIEGHPDNVAPALFGGFCVAGLFEKKPRHWVIPAPDDLKAIVVIPDLPLPTKAARKVLPKNVHLADAVFTASRVAFLLGALLRKRYDWLGEAMEDVLHQPYRKALVPGLLDVIAAARLAGAYGAALSGAGSCVLAFSPVGSVEKHVGQSMQRAFAQHKVKSEFLSLKLENKGVRFQ